MRVLMTADAVGGVWTYSLVLARALRAFGIEVELAVMGPEPSANQRLDAAGLQVFARPYRLEWMDCPWEDVAAAGSWLLQLVEERRPDLVHCNGFVHAVLPFPCPVVVVAHSCVSSWWRAVLDTSPPDSWNEYRRRVSAGIHAADAVVAVSHAMGEMMSDEYGRHADYVSYNGLSSPKVDDSIVRRRAVFCAGRFWDQAKNLRVIEQAAPRIDAEVFVAGEGWESTAVYTLGKLDKAAMGDWYSRCQVFCHPALYEPFGLAPLEAALHGCALVLGDIPSLREVWRDAALFASPRDPEKLAEAVNALLNDATRRSEYVRKAHARAELYSVDKQALEYRNVYASVLVRSGSERAQISAMTDPKTLRVAVLATDGVEEAEFVQPVAALRERGFTVDVLSTHSGEIQSFQHHDKASKIAVDGLISDAAPESYAGLLLPGGALNADAIRVEPGAKSFVQSFDSAHKPIAFICHAPWLMISANVVSGRTLTGFHTIEDDVRNAGGHWVDHEVCTDFNWVSSRKPADLPAFNREMIATFLEFAPKDAKLSQVERDKIEIA